MIVEYTLDRNEQGNLITPSFIKDGGYFSTGNLTESTKLVGHTVNDSSSVPSNLVELDRAALITRLTNSEYSFNNEDGSYTLATAEEIESIVDDFISKYD